jgi:hypothetical protein
MQAGTSRHASLCLFDIRKRNGLIPEKGETRADVSHGDTNAAWNIAWKYGCRAMRRPMCISHGNTGDT